ncbi:hypothetical protein [Haladaptatus salinisoli]|uniref:hypothetical protein n=1 Tax=Haladaptatus salinisoli TaxID=2884876 RepID=UPI001D099F38|nr:hypothetical protein [Haladaptatus salinisoli]
MVAVAGVVGSVLLGLGLLGVRHAYGVARFEERLDAVGSARRTGSVEPAEWNVALTRVLGGCLAAVGAAILLFAAFG